MGDLKLAPNKKKKTKVWIVYWTISCGQASASDEYSTVIARNALKELT